MKDVASYDVTRALWQKVNLQLVAKAIGELHFEEALFPEKLVNGYRLCSSRGVVYQFQAEENFWQHLVVDPHSLRRWETDGSCSEVTAARFFVDLATDLNMSQVVLGSYLEEVNNTLFADMRIQQLKEERRGDALLDLPADLRQGLLSGHPKAIPSKGRMGWGLRDAQWWAPESDNAFQLYWVAVEKGLCDAGFASNVDNASLLRQSMNEAALNRFENKLRHLNIHPESYYLIPLHPWQWDRVIAVAFAGELAEKKLVFLGAHGDHYKPLISLRTLVNQDRPWLHQIKLPITILNTSCYRGLPADYIRVAPALSNWLKNLFRYDPLFREHGSLVMGEPAGIACIHPTYKNLPKVPYRYREMLGAVWRESVMGQLETSEKPILTGALYETDERGDSLAGMAIKRSGLTPRQWVAAYADAVIVPLYHLLCAYGVGLVAHGQNITVSLDQGKPCRLIIKDLQGDLRLLDEDLPEMANLPEDVLNTLVRLPANYLIHDLQTGHFVTVLRFLSFQLQREGLLAEDAFYEEVAERISLYQVRHPHLNSRFQRFDLFKPEMERLCINRVRFQQGYGDSDQRPLPILGSPLSNPLSKIHLTEVRT